MVKAQIIGDCIGNDGNTSYRPVVMVIIIVRRSTIKNNATKSIRQYRYNVFCFNANRLKNADVLQ